MGDKGPDSNGAQADIAARGAECAVVVLGACKWRWRHNEPVLAIYAPPWRCSAPITTKRPTAIRAQQTVRSRGKSCSKRSAWRIALGACLDHWMVTQTAHGDGRGRQNLARRAQCETYVRGTNLITGWSVDSSIIHLRRRSPCRLRAHVRGASAGSSSWTTTPSRATPSTPLMTNAALPRRYPPRTDGFLNRTMSSQSPLRNRDGAAYRR